MTLLPPNDDRSDTCNSRWLAAGSAQAHIGALEFISSRTTNLVALRADLFIPTNTTMLRRRPIAATA